MSRPALAVADGVRQHGETFLAREGPTLCGEHRRALRALARRFRRLSLEELEHL